MGWGGFSKSQEHRLSVGTVGIRRFGVTSGSLGHWVLLRGPMKFWNQKWVLEDPVRLLKIVKSWRYILEVDGKCGDA